MGGGGPRLGGYWVKDKQEQGAQGPGLGKALGVGVAGGGVPTWRWER